MDESSLPVSSVTAKVSQITIPFASQIPEDARVFIPKSIPGSYFVYAEFDGNPGPEGVIFLEHPDYPSHIQLNLYSQEGENWVKKGWSLIQGEELDWVYLHKQFIYVGIQLPNQKKVLYIYLIDTIGKEWTLNRINTITYHKLHIENYPGSYGNDDKPEIARWTFDKAGQENIELFRLNSWEYNFSFVYAEDSYPFFFPDIVSEYQEKVRSNSSNLALAIQLIAYETYANYSDTALQKIKRLLQSSTSSLTVEQKHLLTLLQCKCLLQLHRYEEAQLVLQNWIPDIPEEPFSMKFLKKKAYIALQDALLYQKKYAASKSVWEMMPTISSDEYKANDQLIELNPHINIAPKANYIEPYHMIQEYYKNKDFSHLLIQWKTFQEWGLSQTPPLIISNPTLPSFLSGTYEGMVLFQIQEVGTVIAWAEDRTIHMTPFFFIHSFSHQQTADSKPDRFYTNKDKLGLILVEEPSKDLFLKSYQYLVLRNGSWKIEFSSPFYPNGSIHVNEPNFEIVTAKGQIVLDATGKGYLFGECNSSTYHRYYQEIWILENGTYNLMSSSIVQSPYQTLVDYLYYLYNGNIENAEELVTEPSIIKQTHDLEIVGNTGFYSCPKWVLNSKGEDVITFRIKDKENVAFYFTQKQGKYIIFQIEENPDLSTLHSQPSQ
jgi:hypothetical protein